MMRTVKLYGELGRRYGRVHRFDVRTPAEAIRALGANYKSFVTDLVESESKGVGYCIRNGSFELENVEQVKEPAARTISIIPKAMGGSAGTRILLGAALVAAIFFAPYTGAAGSFLALAGSVGTGIGVSLVLSGVAQLLSPQPKSPEPSERPENKPSYLFNGPVNTTAQGQPVPVGYGRLIVGGGVVSAGISLEQLKEGYKRVSSEASRIVDFAGNGNLENNTKIPENWFKREYLGQVGFIYRWRYYYYVWTLVAV